MSIIHLQGSIRSNQLPFCGKILRCYIGIGRAKHIRTQVHSKRYILHHWKDARFVVKVVVKFIIAMVKLFFRVPSIICAGDAHQPYQIFPSSPDDDSVIRVFIHTDAVINPGKLVGSLLYVKGGSMSMSTTIVTTSSSNAGIAFAVPIDWFKPAVEDIVLSDRLLRRGKGTNVEGGNCVRLSPGWMGVDFIGKRVGIWKSLRDQSEV